MSRDDWKYWLEYDLEMEERTEWFNEYTWDELMSPVPELEEGHHDDK